MLPPQSWAYNGNVPAYEHDPQKARQLLDAAGYQLINGVRFHLTMKTSTVESTRLMVAVMQQQLREVGIALDIRSFEFATFSCRRESRRFPDVQPALDRRQSRSRYLSIRLPLIKIPSQWRQPRLSIRIREWMPSSTRPAAKSIPEQRKSLYAELQQILAEELPYIDLWYLDNVLVHNKRVQNVQLNPAGNYDFLRTAQLAPLSRR